MMMDITTTTTLSLGQTLFFIVLPTAVFSANMLALRIERRIERKRKTEKEVYKR